MEPEKLKFLSITAVLLSTAATTFTTMTYLEKTEYATSNITEIAAPGLSTPLLSSGSTTISSGEVEQLRARLAEVEAKSKQTNDELWDKKQEIEKLKTQINESQQQIIKMDQHIASIMQENDQLHQKKEQLESELVIFQQCVKDAKDVFDTLLNLNPIRVMRRIEIGAEVLDIVNSAVRTDGMCRRAWHLLNQSPESLSMTAPQSRR